MTIRKGFKYSAEGLASKQAAARRVAREYAAEAAEAREKHGHARRGQEHPLLRLWIQMRARCRPSTNAKAMRNYYLRGIRVCPRWEAFELFLADVGPRPSPRHSLERIDNDGHYEPGNVRWATPKEQARNTRQNRMLPLNGELLPLVEWAARVGISYQAAVARLNRGWTPEEIIAAPEPRARRDHAHA